MKYFVTVFIIAFAALNLALASAPTNAHVPGPISDTKPLAVPHITCVSEKAINSDLVVTCFRHMHPWLKLVYSSTNYGQWKLN